MNTKMWIIWIVLISGSSGSNDLDLAVAAERVGSPTPTVNIRQEVTVVKCCPEDSMLIESRFGLRRCASKYELRPVDLHAAETEWVPSFHSLNPPHNEVIGPRNYTVKIEIPECSGPGESQFPVFIHDQRTDDSVRLLSNGSVSHQLIHFNPDSNETSIPEKMVQPRIIYNPGKYCVDDMLILGNATLDPEAGDNEVVLFSLICVENKIDPRDVVEQYVYPTGVAVSMSCLVLTFLMYAMLPQLRDLTGKFILGICGFSVATFSLTMVDIHSWRDANVDKVTTEMFLHSCTLGIWLCMNSMGHHVWKIIGSKSVFTRVSDGQRLKYYSLYIFIILGIFALIATCVHVFVEEGKEGYGNFMLGWQTLASFYSPVAVLLLINVYFYMSSQRRMAKHLIYNRSMQHFQVNFDLFTKFLLVIGIWWLFRALALLQMSTLTYISYAFDILLGPLVFLVAMCRTRVSFLFKRYFCIDQCCCCKAGNFTNDDLEFIEDECQELATIDVLKDRAERKEDQLPSTKKITKEYLNSRPVDKELSASLFNVRTVRREPGEVLPPPDPDQPLGRVKKLLTSNSLTALANINFGWRKETSV